MHWLKMKNDLAALYLRAVFYFLQVLSHHDIIKVSNEKHEVHFMQAIRNLYYDKRYHSKIVFLLIQALFLGLILLITGKILTQGLSTYVTTFDSADHLQESQEIAYDIMHFKWPSFVYAYGVPGDAMATYYPWLGFLGFVISDLFKWPLVTSLRIMFFLSFYIMFNVSYYAALSYWHNKQESILFAIFTIFTPSYLEMFDVQRDYAQALGLSFLILTIFGWLHWVKNKHWQMLAIGMILLTYTNFVLAYMAILTLGLLTIFMPHVMFNKKRIINVLKAASVTIIITMAIWFPLLVLSLSNKVDIPLTLYVADNNFTKIYSYYLLPAADVIILLVMLFHFTRLTYIAKRILSMVLISILLIYRIIPLQWQETTPVKPIQFIWRLILIVHPLLIVVWIPIFYNLYHQKNWSRTMTMTICGYLISFVLINAIILLQNDLANQASVIESPTKVKSNVERIAVANFQGLKKYQRSTIFRGKFYIGEYLPKDIIQQNNKVPKKFLVTDAVYSYTPDVYFQQYFEQHHIKCINNGIKFTQKHSQVNIQVPLALYHGQNYQIYDNGHRVQRYSHRCHELVLPKVNKGVHRITFDAPVMWYRYFATIVSTGSVLIWIIIDLKRRKDKL